MDIDEIYLEKGLKVCVDLVILYNTIATDLKDFTRESSEGILYHDASGALNELESFNQSIDSVISTLTEYKEFMNSLGIVDLSAAKVNSKP